MHLVAVDSEGILANDPSPCVWSVPPDYSAPTRHSTRLYAHKKNRNLPAPKCERENVGAGLSGRSKSVRWDWGTMSHRMLSVGPPPLCLSTFLRPSLAMTWWRESLESLRSKRVSRELGGFKAFLDNPHPPLLFYTLLDWKMLHFGTVRRKKNKLIFFK